MSDIATAVLRNIPLFDGVNDNALATLASRSRHQKVSVGKKVLREGDAAEHVYLLLAGGVRIWHGPARPACAVSAAGDDDGGEGQVDVRLMGPPALFGESEVMLGLHWRETVESVLDSVLLVIPQNVFLWLFRTSAPFSRALAIDLARRLLNTSEHVRLFAFGSAEARLADLVLDHAALFGAPSTSQSSGTRIITKLNQTRLAAALAVSRRAVHEIIQRWIDDGVLAREAGRYVVTDVKRLRALGTGTAFGLAHVDTRRP